MMIKKDQPSKCVHRFTENALMKFRPLNYQTSHNEKSQPNRSFANTVSSILGGLFKGSSNIQAKGKPQSNRSLIEQNGHERGLTKNKSSFIERRNISFISNQSHDMSLIDDRTMNASNSVGNIVDESLQENSLYFVQKMSSETFLIGNQYQIDSITIAGIYENMIDTDLNWNFSLKKPMRKLALDTRKQLLAVEVPQEIWIYKYNLKKPKAEPVYVNRIKVLQQIQYLLFVKDGIFGVFYSSHFLFYQVEENNAIRLILNKKYDVADSMTLIQVPKPIENILNIFFKERSATAQIHTLWRLELDIRTINSNQKFKSLMRIYDIPNRLLPELKINNYTKDTFIMNFKYEILAAKDGYIMDSANINIEEEQSYLIHHGDHLLLVSDIKLELYNFKIATNVKPHKIVVQSVDSIEIKKDRYYRFVTCLEMLNGNFVLFYQIKPQFNRKAKGQIDYIVTATQKLSVSQKLNEIFAFKSPQHLRQVAEFAYEEIEHKCDMAFKIGLSRKEVFLQLWNKSGKSQIDDYKFLLDTMDYQTIKFQIQKKLKKASMPFREVYKLQQYCFEMLRKEVYSNNCSEEAIKNYIKSHFFLRKLQFFRDSQIFTRKTQDEDEKRSLNIDIQQYFNCINSELKSTFLELAYKITSEDKEVSQLLRYFIRAFKFPLRIIYSRLLQDLIIQSKNRLIRFLKAIPQILPYSYSYLPQGADRSLYQSLCSPIEAEEWSKNMHLDEITTIYNKQRIEEVTKTVWFKRNQYTLHDLIPLTKQKILQIQQFDASDNIFYFFIEKIFEHCPKDQEEVVMFLQSNYDQLPQHLKGRIFLYRKLFDYFKEVQCNSPMVSSFNTFLKMQDFELFRQLFKYQKVNKGCLLKDAKQIYAQIPDGNQIYNQSLLSYFTSDISEISDLKCILNRLNNQKRQFHIENQGIYQVLVKGMQTKLKLGSQNDIPLEEVMIYVENIPLTKNNPIIEELKTIQKINQEAQRFKSIKINLSFLQIMEKEEFVISALLDEQIRKKGVMEMGDEEEFISATYEILAEIQIVKQKIYKEQFRDLEYFLYLNKLLQKKQMIRFARVVLEDPHLSAEYVVDEVIVENLILYMYKWRLEEETYVQHREYVRELITMLPPENSIRNYIEAETEFAVMLSTPDHPVEYPLTVSDQESGALTSVRLCEIQSLFSHLSAQFIVSLDLEKLHSFIKIMQAFYEQEIIKLDDIYELAIKRLLNLKQIKKAIPKVRKLIQLKGDSENYSVVFCYLILSIIIVDIPTENHKRNLAKIAFYTYPKPLQLLDIIQTRINSIFSTTEEEHYFETQLNRVKAYKCYDPENPLLDQDIIAKVKEKEEKFNPVFENLIFHAWDQVSSSRDDFSRFEYTSVFIFFLHNPNAFSKYISVIGDHLNIRIIRSYLSYLYKEEIFNRVGILKFAKRAFIIAFQHSVTQLTAEYIISQYKGVGLDQEQQLDNDPSTLNPLQAKLFKSIKAFKKKIENIKNKQMPPEEPSLKKKRIEGLLSREVSMQMEQSEYPFSDSDDDYQSSEEEVREVNLATKKKIQKKTLRQQKNLALFLSSHGGEDAEIRKTSPRMLKTSLTFHNQFQSVHFSKKQKKRKRSDYGGKGADLGIMRTESIGANEGDEIPVLEDICKSQDIKPQQNKRDTIEEDLMYISLEERKANNPSLKPLPVVNWSTKSYSPHFHKSQGDHSPPNVSEANSPTTIPNKLLKKQSQIEMKLEEEPEVEIGMGITESLELPELAFTVNIQEINDEDYSPPAVLAKQLLEDYDTGEAEPIFNLAVIQGEKEKQFDNFPGYLQKLVTFIYESCGKPLSVLLQLIKQIQAHYPEVEIQTDFLKIYMALQNYNTKYKYNLPIREMFPIQGIFLKESDIRVLFEHVKQQILSYVDFDKLMIVAKVIHFSFQKSEIKDELYYSYLCHAIKEYGNDTLSTEEELLMEKQRIGGIIDQITLVNIFVERGAELLKTISIPQRKTEIAKLIKEALKKKKKDALIGQFQKVVSKVE